MATVLWANLRCLHETLEISTAAQVGDPIGARPRYLTIDDFRILLDKTYGLKRWQIGEIASKIGQLYYHFYIRTSKTNYLNEAFAFYAAIRTRAYYSKVNREQKPDIMVKKLRYYARFIVVCLLLKKTPIILELVRELSRHIDDYVKAYDPDDSLEWQLVLNEISAFIEVEKQLHIDHLPVALSYRLSSASTPPLPMGIENILSNKQFCTLDDIIIIGNCQDQIKFSERKPALRSTREPAS